MMHRSRSTLAIMLIALALAVGSEACNATHPYSYGGQCYPECPWNSTLVTYLDTSSNNCLTSTSSPT